MLRRVWDQLSQASRANGHVYSARLLAGKGCLNETGSQMGRFTDYNITQTRRKRCQSTGLVCLQFQAVSLAQALDDACSFQAHVKGILRYFRHIYKQKITERHVIAPWRVICLVFMDSSETSTKYYSRWWFKTFLIFTPIPEEMI